MRIGLFYLFSEFGDVPQDRIFREVLEEIDYGEQLGFDDEMVRLRECGVI